MSLDDEVKKAFEGLAGEVGPRGESWAGIEARVRRSHRRRLTVVSVVVIAVAAGAALAIPRLRPSPPVLVPAPRGWATYHDPQFGWSMSYPASWHLQSFDEQSRISFRGALVSNLDHAFRHPAIKDGYTTAWDMRGLPSDLVVVQFQHAVDGPARPTPAPPDSTFPLSLDAAPMKGPPGRAAGDEYGAPPSLALPVTVRGDAAYSVVAWIAPDAPEGDKDLARRVVASIAFDAGGTPAAGDLEPASDALRFVDASHGWAAGAGFILATTDGGRTWTRQDSGQANISSLDFVDVSRGWALAGDRFLATADGGRGWVELDEPFRPLRRIDFVDSSTGFGITSDRALVRSADGGRSWSAVDTPVAPETLCFTGARAGWVAAGRKVLRTDDGGSTWATSFEAPLQGEGWRATLGCKGSSAWVLLKGGVAASQQAYAVFRTLDGARWEAVLQGQYTSPLGAGGPSEGIDAYAGPFDIVDSSVAFFAGFCPACDPQPLPSITRTDDGGRTWEHFTIQAAAGGEPQAVSFTDARRGWLLATLEDGTEVYATADGGRTWSRQYAVPAG